MLAMSVSETNMVSQHTLWGSKSKFYSSCLTLSSQSEQILGPGSTFGTSNAVCTTLIFTRLPGTKFIHANTLQQEKTLQVLSWYIAMNISKRGKPGTQHVGVFPPVPFTASTKGPPPTLVPIISMFHQLHSILGRKLLLVVVELVDYQNTYALLITACGRNQKNGKDVPIYKWLFPRQNHYLVLLTPPIVNANHNVDACTINWYTYHQSLWFSVWITHMHMSEFVDSTAALNIQGLVHCNYQTQVS